MSAVSVSWTPEIQRDFRREGYVHFKQLLPPDLIASARQAILDDVQKHFDPARLLEYNNRSWCPELRGSEKIKRLFANRAVQAVTDQALGRKRYGWDTGQIAIRQAHSANQPSAPVAHIDGIPTPHNGLAGGDIQNFTALLGVFLTEVKSEYAGNFTVWPGSHLILEQYFREQGPAAVRQGMPAVPIGNPVQLLSKPGDVVLCHYELAHTAAVNTSDQDRIAIFFRLWFNDTRGPEQADRRWHNLTDIWHGWQI